MLQASIPASHLLTSRIHRASTARARSTCCSHEAEEPDREVHQLKRECSNFERHSNHFNPLQRADGKFLEFSPMFPVVNTARTRWLSIGCCLLFTFQSSYVNKARKPLARNVLSCDNRAMQAIASIFLVIQATASNLVAYHTSG